MIDVVCAVIEDGGGRFLACQRPQGKHLAGLWEFPGGKVDHGESPREALVREILEELGVHVDVGAALEPVVWEYAEKHIRLIPFLCTIMRGDLEALEHERIHWCEPADFDALTWAEADLPIVEQIRGRLRGETAN